MIKEKCPNASSTDRLEGAIAQRLEEKVVNRRKQICVALRHEDFSAEIHATKRSCVVTEEGAEVDVFGVN